MGISSEREENSSKGDDNDDEDNKEKLVEIPAEFSISVKVKCQENKAGYTANTSRQPNSAYN